MVTWKAEALQDKRESLFLHSGTQCFICPQMAFSGISDSKTRGKAGIIGFCGLKLVDLHFQSSVLTVLHGCLCKRKKFLVGSINSIVR